MAKGDEKRSLVALQQALELGEPENRVMTFVREGAAMEKLLRLAQAKAIAPQFVGRLLAVFESRRKPVPIPSIPDQALVEPLSARELEVLKLLAKGCADKQIAETLVISPETVHKHLKNIYEKLDVHSRTEAVARARQLDLV
jgi:LuxR family maltose regulon positive regulatory protein